MSTVSIKDLEALIEQFRRSDWREMHLRVGDTELFLSSDGESRIPARAVAPNAAAVATAASSPAPLDSANLPTLPVVAASAAVKDVPAGWVLVRALSLGSFYRAAKPGSPPFTEIGARVTPASELCMIEVMKLFTTLLADVAGTVRAIYAKDGELVEFNQPLFLIEPDV